MSAATRQVRVYADWKDLKGPRRMGALSCDKVRGKEIFAFEYESGWLGSGHAQQLDPDLDLFAGKHYLREERRNFGLFLDSSPDRWGRLLMRRREACDARLERRPERSLSELDYLLGVYDGQRMGAIRFQEGDRDCFLNSDGRLATPPWTTLRDLEYASRRLDEDDTRNDDEAVKWLNQLMAPGSSLGGARPKAGVMDVNGVLWIAKFPSRRDDWDVGAWEAVVHELARMAGLRVPEAQWLNLAESGRTFLSRRFDRTADGQRIHFASAMTLLGYSDGTDAADGVSYLEIAEFIMGNGCSAESDLSELWRRIVFNICVSNTDDHLRNHGFLLGGSGGWQLAPAYDLNPNPHGEGLSLNITASDNSLDLDVAMQVAEAFGLRSAEAEETMHNIREVTGQWRSVASRLKLPRAEQDKMSAAFSKSSSL